MDYAASMAIPAQTNQEAETRFNYRFLYQKQNPKCK